MKCEGTDGIGDKKWEHVPGIAPSKVTNPVRGNAKSDDGG
jgi:hypothetical protein